MFETYLKDGDDNIVATVKFRMTDVENTFGTVVSVSADSPQIESFIKYRLSGNPENIHIEGGHRPDNVGKWSDGVWWVMDAASERYGLVHDDSDMVFYKAPEGATP